MQDCKGTSDRSFSLWQSPNSDYNAAIGDYDNRIL